MRLKKQKQCTTQALERGDCGLGLSLASTSGFMLAARVGKHTNAFIDQLVVNIEGKTVCKQFNTDDWGGCERVLPPEIEPQIGKDRTQKLKRTNDLVRPQTGRWHRRQNKFGKVWEMFFTINGSVCEGNASSLIIALLQRTVVARKVIEQ